jgi:anthranilate phosphoribosyltransferase
LSFFYSLPLDLAMSMPAHHAVLGRLSAGEHLTVDEAAAAVDAIMRGEWTEGETALLLTGLRDKGETPAEIAGAAQAMRRHMRPIRTSRTGVIDTCGTGGVGSHLFNVSTTAAIVTAAAGVPVAKHGNRRVTSKSGSADVLAELGVNIDADVPVVEACLDELGLCFCFAPLLHRAMKHVAPVRQKLGGRTIFNLLGPLTNPAGAKFQLLGVGRAELRPLLADALMLLGTERATIAGGDDGLGEVTVAGPTDVIEVIGREARSFRWKPDDFGIEPISVEAATVDSPAASAAIIGNVLAGKPGPARDLVVINAAAALWTAGHETSTMAAADRARGAIDSGAARELLAKLIAKTRG